MSKRGLWVLIVLSILCNVLSWFCLNYTDNPPDVETLKGIFLAGTILFGALSTGLGVYSFTLLFVQMKIDREARKASKASLRVVELNTRLFAAQQLGMNVDTLRNYELEEKLSKPDCPVVISELCPFNGVYCSWIYHCPEEILDDIIESSTPSAVPYLKDAKQRRFGNEDS